jgi:hypothetical protein
MADEFQLLTSEEAFISVKHVGEGHRFAFYVDTDPRGRRLSPTIAVKGRPDAARKAEVFISQARTFAELEARKAGLIDRGRLNRVRAQPGVRPRRKGMPHASAISAAVQ